MGLRFLVVEGNTRDKREAHRRVYGLTPGESYGDVLQAISPGSFYDLALPADEGANLPDPSGLQSYDGIVLTGSSLNIYDRTPEILRQVDLMRACYASHIPVFGSCWGLQVAAVAAGGDVHRNPKGREIVFARRLTPTQIGCDHPLLEGRPAAFDAPAIHLDLVTSVPSDATVLASNTMAGVQAAEIRESGGVFWGVQYHPEFSLGEMAAMLSLRVPVLTSEGFCRSPEAAASLISDLEILDKSPDRFDLSWRYGLDEEVLDPVRRTREIRNFIDHRVKPEKSARMRA